MSYFNAMFYYLSMNNIFFFLTKHLPSNQTKYYSAVFLLHAPALAPIKISFGVVRCGVILGIVSVVSVKLTPLVSMLYFNAMFYYLSINNNFF